MNSALSGWWKTQGRGPGVCGKQGVPGSAENKGSVENTEDRTFPVFIKKENIFLNLHVSNYNKVMEVPAARHG